MSLYSELDQRYFTKGQTLGANAILQLFNSAASGDLGPATAATVPPNTVVAGKSYSFTTGGVFTNFKDFAGNPIEVPVPGDNQFLTGGELYYNGTYWSAAWILKNVPTQDISGKANQADLSVLASTVNSTFTLNAEDGIVRLLDTQGNIATFWDLNGNQHLFKLFLSLLELGNIEISETPDYEFVITDSYNNILLKIDLGDYKLQGVFSSPPPLPSTYTKTPGQLFDIEYTPLYGQSLSIGTNGLPALTTAQRYKNLMFKGGIRFWDAAGNTQDLTDFALAVENVSPNNPALGETAVSGLLNMFTQRIADVKGIAYNAPNYDYALLGAAPGFGGQSIAQLSKGSIYYQRFIDSVTAGKSLAAAAGKTFGVRCVYWIQGDNDATGNAATYKAALKQLRTDLNTDIKAIIGANQPDIPIIMYQFCQHNFYNAGPTIGLAQLELAKSEPGFYISNPGYPLEYSGDNRHYSNLGNLHQGVYLGKVGFDHLIQGYEFAPFVAQSYKKYGTIAEVKFNPPNGKMAFDIAVVPAQTNMGFGIVDGGAGAIAITSVAIVRPDTIRFVFSRAVASGDKLTYAQNGVKNSTAIADQAKGNLRDTAGDTIIYNPAGDNYKAHNWALMHDFTF